MSVDEFKQLAVYEANLSRLAPGSATPEPTITRTAMPTTRAHGTWFLRR